MFLSRIFPSLAAAVVVFFPLFLPVKLALPKLRRPLSAAPSRRESPTQTSAFCGLLMILPVAVIKATYLPFVFIVSVT